MAGGVLPDGFATMSPGPGLGAALAGIEVAEVPNDDIVEVLLAESRQLAHQQARVWAAMAEVIGRRPFARPGEVRRDAVPQIHGADEVRAALTWTRRHADRETDLAHSLVEGLPLVQHAVWAGQIDRGRAAVFAEHLADLTSEQAESICRALLPQAGRLTTGQLAARLLRMIIQVDPRHYERRYRKAVRDRRVVGYLDPNGTATITATGLPAAEAAAALDRVDDLARATRRAGHPGTLDQLRADIVLGLLDGTLHHRTARRSCTPCSRGPPAIPTPATTPA